MDWASVIESIDLSRFGGPDFKWELTFMGDNVASLKNTTHDRDLPHLTIGVCHTIGLPPRVSKENAIRYLHETIIQAVIHELNEQLLIDGQRLFDPHLAKSVYFNTKGV